MSRGAAVTHPEEGGGGRQEDGGTGGTSAPRPAVLPDSMSGSDAPELEEAAGSAMAG